MSTNGSGSGRARLFALVQRCSGCDVPLTWDTRSVRGQFPILQRGIQTLDGTMRPLVYLDHGASTHAPRPVIDAVTSFLEGHYANIHRGNHTLSLEASEKF